MLLGNQKSENREMYIYAGCASASPKHTIADAVICSMYPAIYFGTDLGFVPWPCPLSLFLPVGTPLSRRDLRLCSGPAKTEELSRSEIECR